jgi:hypothetical protein
VGHQNAVAAPAASQIPPPPPVAEAAVAEPTNPDAEAALAEVLALLPRVNANWRSYIATRLEVDTGSAERLRKVRDWTLARVELAPAAGRGGDDTPAGGAGN